MDQRVKVTAGPKLNNPHLADGLDIYDGMVTNAAVTEALHLPFVSSRR
jgi:alanine dehydrogenase